MMNPHALHLTILTIIFPRVKHEYLWFLSWPFLFRHAWYRPGGGTARLAQFTTGSISKDEIEHSALQVFSAIGGETGNPAEHIMLTPPCRSP